MITAQELYDQAKAAADKAGLKLSWGIFIGDGYCCPATALLLDKPAIQRCVVNSQSTLSSERLAAADYIYKAIVVYLAYLFECPTDTVCYFTSGVDDPECPFSQSGIFAGNHGGPDERVYNLGRDVGRLIRQHD